MVDRQHFASIPESGHVDEGAATRFHPRIDYLDALESLSDELHNYIQHNIQDQEDLIRRDYAVKLRDVGQKAGDDRKKIAEDEQKALSEYDAQLEEIRQKRDDYRNLLYQVHLEKKKLLESMRVNRQEENFVRKRLNILGSHLPESPDRNPRWSISSIVYLAVLLLTIVIYLLAETFPWNYEFVYNVGYPNRIADHFLFFTHIALFVFVGFALLNSFMGKYLYSGLVLSLLVAAWAFLWTILWGNLWGNINGGYWQRDGETIFTIISALYGSTALLVIFSAILGRASLLSLLVVTFLGTFWYSVNQYVCEFVLLGVDYAGPNHLWLFASSFGVFISAFTILPGRLFHRRTTKWVDETRDFRHSRRPSYYSDVFAIVGTLIMWVTFPSFNGAFAPDTAQFRVVINVIIALCSSTVFAFLTSYVFNSGYYKMIHIQRATLAGGIACSSAFAQGADPGGAMVLGAIAGILAVAGFRYFNPYASRRYGLLDEGGVFSFVWLPALAGSVAAIIQTFLKGRHEYVYGAYRNDYYPHGSSQAGFQAAILFISIFIGIGGGLVSGFLIWFIEYSAARINRRPLDGYAFTYYSDEANWHLTSDFERTVLKKDISRDEMDMF